MSQETENRKKAMRQRAERAFALFNLGYSRERIMEIMLLKRSTINRYLNLAGHRERDTIKANSRYLRAPKKCDSCGAVTQLEPPFRGKRLCGECLIDNDDSDLTIERAAFYGDLGSQGNWNA